MLRAKPALVVLGIVILLAGCAHHHSPGGGKLIAEYAPGKDADVSKTPYQATYVLRHWPVPPTDPPPREWIPEQQVAEVYVRGLNKRQSIGFEKSSDGKVLAVAGEEKIKLEPGRYCWHIHPSTEYTGLKWLIHETGERTVEIISLPFGLAAAVVVVPFLFGCFLCMWPLILLH